MRDTREPLTEKYVHRPLKQRSVFTQCCWYSYILQWNNLIAAERSFWILPSLVEQPAMSNCITLLYVYCVLGGDDKAILLVLLARKLQTKLFPYRNWVTVIVDMCC